MTHNSRSLMINGWKFEIASRLATAEFSTLCTLPSFVVEETVCPVASSAHTEVRKFLYDGQWYFLKEYFFVNWKKHLKVARRGEKLSRIAHDLERHGFLTPRVVGFGRKGIKRRVITEAVERAQDVQQVLYPDFKHYRGNVSDGFVYAFGRQIGSLHRCGFFHGDLRWRNVLTRREEGEWKFFFIDNDRTVRFRFGIPGRRRIKNLTQVLFSGLLLDWPQNDWRTFLEGYFEDADVSLSRRDCLIAKVEEKATKRLVDRRNRGSSP